MYLLKKLELNGFKSFAQKTSFDFSHGITAIVGPNGSGKSNVIDAIRWLLGERDAKNLRGGKGEDLIFAGTPERARLGQAQASLEFDNTSSFFPVDFPEVVVSRQVNRDGNNQYFVNKSEVRLKDLVDFFAQARLGARGFVVVTQGESDMFIKAAPKERREMIEEILGLREYQLKKTEAERRLKNAQINLDKVKALIDEILPHLRSLKRQTNRWEKRESLENELRELENSLFGGERQVIEKELAAVDAEIAKHSAEKNKLAEERSAAEANLARVEQSQPAERERLTGIKKETQALLEKRSHIQKELGRLEAQLEIAASGPAATPQAEALFGLVKKIKVKLEIALDDPEKHEKVINEILEEIDEVLADSSQAVKTRTGGADIQSRFAAIKQDLDSLEKQIAGLKKQEQELEKSQEEFYQAFKKAVAAVESAKERLEQWTAKNRERQFAKERLGLRREEWERQVQQAGRKPEEFFELAQSEAQVADRSAEAERRIFRLRGELASMGEVDEALITEARETEKRYDFLNREADDLDRARKDLKQLIADLNDKIKSEFTSALHKINAEFDKFFGLMFGGGAAKLKLMVSEKRDAKSEGSKTEDLPEADIKDEVKMPAEEEEPEAGLEIDLKLPRKRITSLGMLSGGERSLVGIAALFALVSVSPPPFLVLDEVDAPLDERNARRFAEMLQEFAKHTQFVIVTHNRVTMEAANILYGVTMNADGTSKVVSLKLEPQAAGARA